MPGLVPGIHVLSAEVPEVVDGRVSQAEADRRKKAANR